MHIKHSTKKSRTHCNLANIHRKNDVWKNARSKGHINYNGFVKSRVGTRLRIVIRGCLFLEACCAKKSSKGCLFENHENRKWHRNQLFRKVRDWDPLKTVPRSGFEKSMKNYWKSMVFDDLKPLKSIEKHTLFLKRLKNDAKGHKSCFWIQNSDICFPSLTYALVFDLLV